VRTRHRGAIVAQLEVGDRFNGRIWKIETIRNQMFAILWNCSNMFLGKNEIKEYFPVEIVLLGKRESELERLSSMILASGLMDSLGMRADIKFISFLANSLLYYFKYLKLNSKKLRCFERF
jgi:hypothetical protein